VVQEEVRPLRFNRDFNLLWTGAAISGIGSIVSLTAYPLVVVVAGGSPGAAGLVAAAVQAPQFLCQLPAGVLADRVNRKTIMLVCNAARAILLAGAAFAVAFAVAGVPLLVALAFLQGVFDVTHGLAETAAIRNVVPAGQLTAAMAANQGRSSAAAMLGRPLGGLLYELGRAVPFAADAATYFFGVITTALTRGPFQQNRSGVSTTSAVADVRAGLHWFWSRPFLRASSLLTSAANFLFQALPLAVIVLAHHLGASPGLTGVILLGAPAGGFLGVFLARRLRRRLSLRQITVGAPCVWTLTGLLIVLAPHPVVLIIATAVNGMAGTAFNVVVAARNLALIPDEMLGRVTAAMRLVGFGAQPLGPLVAGALLAALGPLGGTTALVAGTAVIAATALLSPSLRNPPD
jgi:MFS family permease